MKKKEVDQWGNTHYVVENTYKKPSIEEEDKKVFGEEFGNSKVDILDVPF